MTRGQEQGFPRLFHVGQDPLDPAFPQEINDGNHRQIVVELTTTQDLAEVPITLTVDTVARSTAPAFTLDVALDDGDHCLDACDRQATLEMPGEVAALALPGCARTFLPLTAGGGAAPAPRRPGGSPARSYQLVLKGTAGWGVFDWLRLETPAGVLFTLGANDDRCGEFDNDRFVYPCP